MSTTAMRAHAKECIERTQHGLSEVDLQRLFTLLSTRRDYVRRFNVKEIDNRSEEDLVFIYKDFDREIKRVLSIIE